MQMSCVKVHQRHGVLLPCVHSGVHAELHVLKQGSSTRPGVPNGDHSHAYLTGQVSPV